LEHVHAATYTVGDSSGWTFNTDTWPKGKRFRAGDVLGKFLCHVVSIVYIHSSIVKSITLHV